MTEAEQNVVKEYLASLQSVKYIVVHDPSGIPWAELWGHDPPVVFSDSNGMPAKFRTSTAVYFWWTTPERYVEELFAHRLVGEWDGDRLMTE